MLGVQSLSSQSGKKLWVRRGCKRDLKKIARILCVNRQAINEKEGRGRMSRRAGTSEVRLFSNNKERAMYDNLADLYSILIATEHLEKAFIRDAISGEEYTPECRKLIAQFKTAIGLLQSAPDFNLDNFVRDYNLECTYALSRLVQKGIPATIEHNTDPDPTPTGNIGVLVAQATQNYITAMDALKLDMTAVDEIQPQLQDLFESLNKIPDLPPDFEGKTKLRTWLGVLNTMGASVKLSDEDARQLLFDLDSSYTAFHRFLAG